jgi:hypothetical protein
MNRDRLAQAVAWIVMWRKSFLGTMWRKWGDCGCVRLNCAPTIVREHPASASFEGAKWGLELFVSMTADSSLPPHISQIFTPDNSQSNT